MIISHKHNFIFYKPIKTAGTSVEIALMKHCGNEDVCTGSQILSEIVAVEYDTFPRNNWEVGDEKILEGDEAKEFLEKNSKIDLWNKGYKRIKLPGTVLYDEHTSPVRLKETNFNTQDFTSISIVRNPFDLLISYYWWAFNTPSDSVISYNTGTTVEVLKSRLGYLAPNVDDTPLDLKYKFRKFLDLPAIFHVYRRPSDPNKNILTWFSEWSNEFFLADLDYHIRFEYLKEDFEGVCRNLNLEITELPKFKSSQRKSTRSHKDYYSPHLKKLVENKFEEIIEAYEYKL